VAARDVDLPRHEAQRTGQGRAVRLHAVSSGSAAAKVGLSAGDLLLRANDYALFGVDDLKRALVLGEGQPVRLEVQGRTERRTLSVAPDPPRRYAA
jgi:S1-C subfamily serine protease